MPAILLPLAAILLALPGAAPAATAAALPSTPAALAPKLAAALAGRRAGVPVSCISLARQARASEIVDETAILYKESGRRWWVNFPTAGCPALRPDLALVTVTPSTRLCRGDIVRVVDIPAGFTQGSCTLGPFVPYTR